jgi:hypothetical protein
MPRARAADDPVRQSIAPNSWHVDSEPAARSGDKDRQMTFVRGLRAAGITLVAVTSLVLGTTSAAHADCMCGTDRPKITTSGFDFGGDQFLGSGPTTAGWLWWWNENGSIRADLEGAIWLDNVAGHCARIRMDHHSSAHQLLGSRTSILRCVTTNRATGWNVDLDSFAHHDVDHVIVKLEVMLADGSYDVAGAETWHYGSGEP